MFTGKRIPHWNNPNGELRYIKGIAGPSTRSTLAWLDIRQEYFQDEPLLIWDHLGGHKADEVQDWLEDHDVRSLLLPARTSGIMDPCDNSWHSALKSAIRRVPHQDLKGLLDRMVECYWAPSESEVQNHIKHCGYNSLEDPEKVVTRLFSEGYYAASTADPEADKMIAAYEAHKAQVRVLRNGVADFRGPIQLKDCDLDGVCWRTFHVKNRTP
jgi:hypothetical protein